MPVCPAFIRKMLARWGSPETRAQIVGVLEAIERLA